MGFFSSIGKILDPGNVFGTRDGGLDVSGMIDPGGEIIQNVTGWDDAKTIADPAGLHSGDDGLLGGMLGGGAASVDAKTPIVPVTDYKNGLPVLPAQGSADNDYAMVTYALWNDYKTNFAPAQYALLDEMSGSNPAKAQDAVNYAMGRASYGMDVAKGGRQRQLEGYGMNITGDARAAMSRQDQLRDSLAVVNAANQTRRSLKDRDNAIMTGGSVPNTAGRSFGLTEG
jgi:hypothetical protein